MMKKFLFVAAAVVASMVFTGCINEDDTYKKLQPVQQGINIYNWTSSQYSMATEQANIGMRMAMLVAEADKQGVEKLEDVKIEGVSIKSKLLGTSSTIEKTTTGYKITFNPAYMDMDGYSREGAVLIVDASQGVEAQTLANTYLALDHDLEILPVINKIDLPAADPQRTKTEIEDIIGIPAMDAPEISAKQGINIQAVLDDIKAREAAGFTYEVADGSLGLLLMRHLGLYAPAFTLESFRVIVDDREDTGALAKDALSEATVKIHVGEGRFVATGESAGPVGALDAALRMAILESYPQVAAMELTDYKVRLLDESQGTDAITRVTITATDGVDTWGTVGVSENVIEASWNALVDSLEYGLFRARVRA